MGKPRTMGMINRCIPNSKADMRYRRKAFKWDMKSESGGGGASTGFVLIASGAVATDVNCKQGDIVLHSQTEESMEE